MGKIHRTSRVGRSSAERRQRSAGTSGPVVRRTAERAMHLIERQKWLDAPGYKLEHGVALTFNLLGARARPLQDLLHGVWLGHPLHPVVTDVPLGAWTTALVLDTADMVAPRPHGFRRAALTCADRLPRGLQRPPRAVAGVPASARSRLRGNGHNRAAAGRSEPATIRDR